MSLTAKEICQQASILEVAGHYIDIRGSSLKTAKAVCPFHEDHNPSLTFYVSRKNGEERFHCFVCHSDGNAADFVRQYEKEYHGREMSYPEAVFKVADICGLDYELPHSIGGNFIKPKNIAERNTEKLQELLSYYLMTHQADDAINSFAERFSIDLSGDGYFRIRESLRDCRAGIVPSASDISMMHRSPEGFDPSEEIRKHHLKSGELTFPLMQGNRQTGFSENELFCPFGIKKDIILCASPKETAAFHMAGIDNAVSAGNESLSSAAMKIAESAQHVTVILSEGCNPLQRASAVRNAGVKTDILPMTAKEAISRELSPKDISVQAVRPYVYALSQGASYEKASGFAVSPLEKYDCMSKAKLLSELEMDQEMGR